ncbi:transcriptional protein SWT1-like [Uloborus diversus]|uniref:transcriptional protein SWT1-like n=1 Tax=Uloborus diversus TaxID=327109 RepID=UPI00240A1EA8|nr:transcriptional protein SWT1-like [Uloborus diversus]
MAPNSSKPLSPDWKIVQSRRYPDKVYYFNVVTGESSWEVPNCSTETTNNKECVKDLNTRSDGQLQSKYRSLERNEMPHSKVSYNKPAQLCQKHQQEKQLQNTAEKKITQKKSSNVIVKPPTAVVAPVVVKKADEYNSEPVDAAVLKRKLQVLYQEQESKEAKKKPRRKKKKKKAQNVDGKSDVLTNSVQVVKHNLCEKHLKESLNIAEAQKKDLYHKSAHSSGLSVSSHNVQTCLRHQNESSQGEVDERVFEDVEMLDVSESLTKIDDLPSSANGASERLASYYIVVDTNVLITELKFIDEIKDTPIEGCGPPHIFIPWIVIQELDGLKKSTKNTTTWRAAGEAVRYLNSVLKAKHPRFHGQSPQEVADWAKTYSKCNDDRILECCISLAAKMPREKVILLTNDKNLSNKALVCDIQVHTWDSMIKVLKTDVVFRGDRSDKKSSSSKRKNDGKVTAETSKSQNSCTHTEEISAKIKSDVYKQEIHTLMSTARQHLKDVLLPVLEAGMQDAYGDVWCEFKLDTKLLKGILEAIKKYWKAVFSFHFSEKEKRKFDLLHEKANQPEGFYGNKEECLIILSDIEDIFLQIKRHWPHINPCVEKIQNIRASCLAAFSNYKGVENSILVTEAQSVFSLFQHNWSVLNQLCGTIMDYCDIPHNFQYEKPAQFPPQKAFRELMCNLYPGVHELKQLMSKVVDAVTNNVPCTDVIKKFYKALKEFVPSLGVKADSPEFPHISSKALEKFCTVPQNREMIENGLKQLLVFHEKLDKAVTVIMSTKNRKTGMSEEDKMMVE